MPNCRRRSRPANKFPAGYKKAEITGHNIKSGRDRPVISKANTSARETSCGLMPVVIDSGGLTAASEELAARVKASNSWAHSNWTSQSSISPCMLEQVAGASRTKATGMDALTDRELEILTLIGKGVATKIIASQPTISARTVEAHRTHIKEKLSMTDGAALVRYAMQWIDSHTKV